MSLFPAGPIQDIPLCTTVTNNFGFSSSISPNNVTAASYYGSIEPGYPWGLPSAGSMVYQYNDDGLPVQQLAGPWGITYTYNKYGRSVNLC